MHALARFQQTIDEQLNGEAVEPALQPRLWWRDDSRGLHVVFHGTPNVFGFWELLELLASAEMAARLVRLEVSGPDEGVNGTHEISLGSLVSPGREFPRLQELRVARNRPAEHNRRVLADEEVLASLLKLAPALEVLESPSAPTSKFFESGAPALHQLCIDAGYDHHGFIRNYAASGEAFRVRCLEFGEYAETYMEDFATLCTPIADYVSLFGSRGFDHVAQFVWRNPVASPVEIAELRALRPKNLAFQLVHSNAKWVR